MTPKVTKHSTMREILEAYPRAQHALFQRYHIGGCSSCGYQPDEALEEVAHRHNIFDLDEVIAFLHYAAEIEPKIQIGPREVATALRGETPPRLVDVRSNAEWELVHIAGATLITEELAQEMMQWPKDTPIVFYCHLGSRSLDAASYFAEHGFTNVRSMTGGIDAWSLQVDPLVPRYEVGRDPYSGRAAFRPLGTVVSQATGSQE